MTELQERELNELLARSKTNEQLLSDPKFWEFYFFAFGDSEKVKEFSQACAIPEDYIKAKRQEWLRNYCIEQSPYWHHGNSALN